MWKRGERGSWCVFGRGHCHVRHRNKISGVKNITKQTHLIIKHCGIYWEEKSGWKAQGKAK